MIDYSVVHDESINGWIVKIQDVAPTDSYRDKEKAIAEAEKLAKEDKPSRLVVYDDQLKVEDEKWF